MVTIMEGTTLNMEEKTTMITEQKTMKEKIKEENPMRTTEERIKEMVKLINTPEENRITKEILIIMKTTTTTMTNTLQEMHHMTTVEGTMMSMTQNITLEKITEQTILENRNTIIIQLILPEVVH